MNKLAILIGAGAAFVATSALAAGNANNNNMYVNVNGGVVFLGGDASDSHNTGWNAGAAVGYQWNQFRFEGAFNWLRNSGNLTGISLHLNQYLFMANAYYDIAMGGPVTPYVGVGAGVDHSTATGFNAGSHFAAQGIVGLNYNINSKVSIGADYHFVWVKTDDGSSSMRNNLINANLAYHFAV